MMMKVFTVVAIFLIGYGIFGGIVSANPLPTPITFDLYLEKNGIPYDGTVEYSLVCYGHTSQNMPSGVKYIRNKTKDDPDPPQEVFHVSGTCPSYGCYGSSYQLWNPGSSEICILNTTVENETFSVWNSSDKPAIGNFKGSPGGYPQYCEFYFTFQSDTAPAVASGSQELSGDPAPPFPNMTFGKRAVATAEYFDPIAMLHCSIVSFLGGRCE